MRSYYTSDFWGYGCMVFDDDSVLPEAQYPCNFFFWKKVPLYYVVEDAGIGKSGVHTYEFFSGIEINLPVDELGLRDGIYTFGLDIFSKKHIPVLEFEKQISKISERKRVLIAQKVREINSKAHEEYLRRREVATKRLESIADAEKRMKHGMY